MILESVLMLGIKQEPTLDEKEFSRLSKQIIVEDDWMVQPRFYLDNSEETEELLRMLLEEIRKSTGN